MPAALFHRRRPAPPPRLAFRDRLAIASRLLLHALLLLAALALLAYAALQLFARSDLFRSRLEASLSALSGMPVRIDGRIRATEALNLKLRDVISTDGDAGLAVGTLRVRWRLFPPRGTSRIESIWLESVHLTLSVRPDGTVSPPFLAACARQAADFAALPSLSALPSPAPAPAAPSTPSAPAAETSPSDRNPVARIPLVRIQNADVHWRDADGVELASADGIDLTWTTSPIPELGMMPRLRPGDPTQLSYFRGYAARIRLGSTLQIAGLRMEIADADGRPYLVLLEAADWGAHTPPPSRSDRSQAARSLLSDPALFP